MIYPRPASFSMGASFQLSPKAAVSEAGTPSARQSAARPLALSARLKSTQSGPADATLSSPLHFGPRAWRHSEVPCGQYTASLMISSGTSSGREMSATLLPLLACMKLSNHGSPVSM